MTHYSFPLRSGELMKKKPEIPRCSLEESIRQHIYLILITRFEENRFDTSYGCELWEYDFESLKVLDDKKHYLENCIKTLLLNYEKRICEPAVHISISEGPLVSHLKSENKIKRKIEVKVRGRVAQTNKVFNQNFVIFFSPVITEGFMVKT